MNLEKEDIMIDEMEEGSPGAEKAPSKGLGMKMMIILGGLILVLCAGGYFGYTLLFMEKGKAEKVQDKKAKEKMVLFSMDPFVLNLSDPNRHLKVAVQFELLREEDELKVKEKGPKLRDTLIMLFSSKTTDSVSSAEGKFQLKDEILLRANQAMDREVFKNVYFTDFVMQ
jgi:flagellar protein FliL